MRIAVITGASSGLGAEFARQIAAKEAVEELWLVARSGDKLEALAAELPVPVRVMAIDLTNPLQRKELEKTLRFESPEVTILCNAAGFGKIGTADTISAQDVEDMIDLNCKALVAVTRLVRPYLRRGSRVLQIASCSGFMPLPGINVYAATKAFVVHYARALREELRSDGIKVSAVCPYWISDTAFIPTAQDTENPGAIESFPFAGRKEPIAAFSLAASKLNLAVITPDGPSALMRVGGKFIPRTLAVRAWDWMREK